MYTHTPHRSLSDHQSYPINNITISKWSNTNNNSDYHPSATSVKRLRHALQLIQVTITTSSIHFTGSTSTNTYIRLSLLLLRLRLSGLYSLHSCSHFASEGWRMKFTRLKAKDDFLLNIMTPRIWKGNTYYNQCQTNNNTRKGSASQMGELFRECLFNLGIMSTSSLIQVH